MNGYWDLLIDLIDWRIEIAGYEDTIEYLYKHGISRYGAVNDLGFNEEDIDIKYRALSEMEDWI